MSSCLENNIRCSFCQGLHHISTYSSGVSVVSASWSKSDTELCASGDVPCLYVETIKVVKHVDAGSLQTLVRHSALDSDQYVENAACVY